MLKCDVIILGGGPAGSAAALTLKKINNYDIIVIEKSNYDELKIGETIQPECRPLLKHLGVWESFVNDDHLPSNGTSAIWGSNEINYNDFIFNAHGYGWHLDRTRFENMLACEAIKTGVNVLTRTSFTASKKLSDDKWLIECKTDEESLLEIKSSFVIDASGRKTVFAKDQHSKKIVHDNLCGIFTFTEISNPDFNSFTFVEAVHDGWWYSARLPDNKVVLGFMTAGSFIKEKQLNWKSNFLQYLKTTEQTKERFYNAETFSDPVVVSANSYILDKIVGDGWLAIGDAACAFDPLSSQGIYKGLHNGITAAETIDNYFSGSTTSLTDYEKKIKASFEQYLEMKVMYYQIEKRWHDSPFWKRRINVHTHLKQVFSQ